MKHNKFPKIGQFRNVIKEVIHKARFIGVNEETGEALYDNTAELPTVQAMGTVKLHGTNAGVTLDLDSGEMYIQSRNNCYKTLGNHFGFSDFVLNDNREWFRSTLYAIADFLQYDSGLLTIFGEWAGEGIQKGIALTELPKAFYIFAVKHKDGDESTWHNAALAGFDREAGIFNIKDFDHYVVTIDFNNPKLSQNNMVEITEQVEAECPVGKARGVSGIGEGVVYSFTYKDQHFWFKVKGEKHSSSKVKKLAEVDVEKLKSIQQFAGYAATENRVRQAMQEVGGTSRKETGDVLRWVANDIMEEEADVLKENGLDWSDVARETTTEARKIFFNIIDNELGL